MTNARRVPAPDGKRSGMAAPDARGHPKAQEKNQAQSKKRSISEIEAASELGVWALMVIGTRAAVPRYLGDNEGTWGVRVVLSEDPGKRARQINAEQLVHEAVVHLLVWGAGREAGVGLKAQVEEMIGEGHEKVHAAAWNADPTPVELIVFAAAAELDIEIWDTDGRDAAVRAHIRRRMRG